MGPSAPANEQQQRSSLASADGRGRSGRTATDEVSRQPRETVVLPADIDRDDASRTFRWGEGDDALASFLQCYGWAHVRGVFSADRY